MLSLQQIQHDARQVPDAAADSWCFRQEREACAYSLYTINLSHRHLSHLRLHMQHSWLYHDKTLSYTCTAAGELSEMSLA